MSAMKRTSLDAVFGVEEIPVARPQKKQDRGQEPEHATAEQGSQPKERGGESKGPTVKQHTAYLPLAVHEQLRRLAFEENRKIHDYLMEGLDRVFENRGLPSVKDLS
jgi:hypothetical protein